MLGIIDRYFLLEVSKVFLTILGTLMLVVISMLFLRTLEEVNIGALSTDVVLHYMGLQILRDTSSLLPPAFFISALVALSRMARDSELIAFGACGLGPGRMYRALLYFALPLALLTAWFSLDLSPWASWELFRIRTEQKEQIQQIAGIQQGRFYQQEQGQLTLYVEEIEEKKRLRNIFIQDRREGDIRLVLSDMGLHHYDEASGDHFVTLLNGRRYDGTPGRPDYAVAEFERYSVRIEPREFFGVRSFRRSATVTRELLASDDLADRAELEHRLAGPVAIFTLAMIAIPLGTTSPRQRASGRMLLAFLTYFSFFNLQRLAENWLETGATPVWIGSLWYQLVVLALVYAVLVPESYWLKRLRGAVSVSRTS
ncbi:MAG: LPS export ABC transporter permease LptF [Pseudomonadota bacterium]|nr:LPS export ABC transporter permease LptF [Pseudomonadota bacterium]